MGDLTENAQSIVIAKGGRGGRGNARFVSATNQAPRQWEVGGKGQEIDIRLELKLLADVGFVGLPNVGKSTLLARLTAARPKIADYPFTTLIPNLGIVQVEGHNSFVAADIPGLIKGAHLGKGLGMQFLRHIERTQIIAMLLQSNSETLEQDYITLMEELDSYGHEIAKKPRIIVYTKCDLLANSFKRLGKKVINETESVLISAVRGDNLDKLKNALWQQLTRNQAGAQGR